LTRFLLIMIKAEHQNQFVHKMKSFWEQKAKQEEPSWKLLEKESRHETIHCSVKCITIQGRTIYEVELLCKCCQGQFVVRAAHECQNDVAEEEGAGLEWLTNPTGDHINLSL
jgi:hypothetical protein